MTTKPQAGKGSKPRPTNLKKFGDNYDLIFKKRKSMDNEIKILINGKVSGSLIVRKDADQSQITALARESLVIKEHILNNVILKEVFVPTKFINFVTKKFF
jgi:leucyl-tRNA synthetase